MDEGQEPSAPPAASSCTTSGAFEGEPEDEVVEVDELVELELELELLLLGEPRCLQTPGLPSSPASPGSSTASSSTPRGEGDEQQPSSTTPKSSSPSSGSPCNAARYAFDEGCRNDNTKLGNQGTQHPEAISGC